MEIYLRFLICFILLGSTLTLGASCSLSKDQKKNTRELLEQIAAAENKSEIAASKMTPAALNTLCDSILKGDDHELVSVLQRALKNYNAFSDAKTDPFIHYYRHYQSSPFFVPKIDLTLDVKNDRVAIKQLLEVKKNSRQSFLALDGVGHKVNRVSVNGVELKKTAYRITPNELIILKIPGTDVFFVEIESEIDPYNNQALEGLYASGSFLTTQCESEGARRIFYTFDRPDVLSRITTTILADDKKYPCRLSNGNLVVEEKITDGRTRIVWEDPIPKPSYLFACVLGDFDKLQDYFTTRSGQKVSLEVYVERGKQERGIYSLYALKKAMEFDERFFDREYDLASLKMVAVPDFNSGAMENKGLLIFNDQSLLVDQHSGTDANFRRVAIVVAHEYFHNWSGNRVTVRNWFELALKEGFTDFRATLFAEELYGFSFIRPKDVTVLKESQFPEEISEEGHPIMVDSYVNARSIYDSTTYVKGREVFRALQTYLDMMMKDGFRKAQNLYYKRYDGQAVTFRELLSAANDVLFQETGKNLTQFDRWFSQQGTPEITIEMIQLNGRKALQVTQSCIHPRTKIEQEPLLIPFSYELLYEDGSPCQAKKTAILTDRTHIFELDTEETVIPIFMHGYSAPVILKYPYTFEELASLFQFAKDPYSQWEAGKHYSLVALQQFESDGHPDLFTPYKKALSNPGLTALAKAQLLQLPSVRAFSQRCDRYDFTKLSQIREKFLKQLAVVCKAEIEQILAEYPESVQYEPNPDQMQIRELRKACLNLLSYAGSLQKIRDAYFSSNNFDTSLGLFTILCNRDTSLKIDVIDDFYNRWKDDKMVFNHWLAIQAGTRNCTVNDLKKLISTPGYDGKNPNHIRSVLSVFVSNLGQYHDPKGEGYGFLVDQIIEIAQFNPMIAHNYLASSAFIDYYRLPLEQKKLMARELRRLQQASIPPETFEMIKELLKDPENIKS
jgi:aminopeptidase N